MRKLYFDRVKINELYWEEEYSLSEIATFYQVSPSTIHRFMIEVGIPVRGRLEALQLHHKKHPTMDFETRRRIGASNSLSLKGHKQSEATKNRRHLALLGRKQPQELIAKRTAPLRGRKLSLEHCENISIATKGRKISEYVRLKASQGLKRYWMSLSSEAHHEVCQKISRALREYAKNNPDKIREVNRKRWQKPNGTEAKFNNMLEVWFPQEWMYNGACADIIIGGKIPDFVNINGKKAVIEIWGEPWHKGEKPEDLEEHYRQYGWQSLVLWSKELKKPELVKPKILYKIYGTI